MKKLLYILSAFVLAGCTVPEIGGDTVEVLSKNIVYTAGFEDVDTKVYVDTDLKTHWTEGDEISIFTSTFNEEYKFDGQTGDLEGSFSAVDDKFHTGASVPTTYAVYPYFEGTSITSEGVITLNLPAVQNYAVNSYGLGANTMVAVTESKSSKALNFKSLCGYVVVRLYGEGTVKSITLTGNNGEKIAGQATVAPVYGQAPVVTMSESATTSIILDCGEGVVLGKTVEDATAFWFAVPPVTFSQGFTIRITNTDLWSMEKAMKVERAVVRNVKNPLSPLEVNFNIPREGNIEFEDVNFKAYCVENFDTNGDGEISYEEGLTVKRIEVNTDSIESLVGIEHFLNLGYLCCRGAQVYNNETQSFTNTGKLSTLDVSKNSKLWYLDCCFNQISCLDITNNLSLSYLLCACNRLTAIDVTKNNQLYYLALEENPLNELDVHNNPSLYHLTLLDNPISSIDLSNNKNLYEIAIGRTLINSIDISNNNKLDYFECVGNTQLESIVIGTQPCLKTLFLTGSKVSSINISGCVELTELIFTYNTEITELNLDNNKRLKKVTCTNNSLSFINIRGNTSLEEVIVYKNHLTSFDAHNCSSLSFLNCQYNSIKSINVDGCSSLLDLRCDNNQLTTLDVSSNTALTYLDCRSNQLTSLDVSNNTALSSLSCTNNPNLTEIWLKKGQYISNFQYDTDVATIKYRGVDDVVQFEDANFKAYCVQSFDKDGDGEISFDEASAVVHMFCYNKNITSLEGIQYFTSLQNLQCYGNQLTSLDVSRNTALKTLSCSANQLAMLDVSNCTALTSLECASNPLTSLDVSSLPDLFKLNCASCQLSALDVSNNTKLGQFVCSSNLLTSLDVSANTGLATLHCESNPLLTVIWLQEGQVINDFQYDTDVATVKYIGANIVFHDSRFKTYCVGSFDTDGDGEVSYKEASVVTSISCTWTTISSLEDIQHFSALTSLVCDGCYLKTLDVSNNKALKSLSCKSNQIASLNISGCSALTYLLCEDNKLTTLDVSNNPALVTLMCKWNPLTTLDVSNKTALSYLDCSACNLSSLSFTGDAAITTLICSVNTLTSLVVSGCPDLEYLHCSENQLTELDVSNNKTLTKLYCESNKLTPSLDVSKNTALTTLWCRSNPNLAEIWLKNGQTISDFQYDKLVSTIKYKD